jgi:hypothetical protein
VVDVKTIAAGVLAISYVEDGPPERWPVILSHGFPFGLAPAACLTLVGHKSITTTVDLCGHLVPEASTRARARDALDKAFGI